MNRVAKLPPVISATVCAAIVGLLVAELESATGAVTERAIVLFTLALVSSVAGLGYVDGRKPRAQQSDAYLKSYLARLDRNAWKVQRARLSFVVFALLVAVLAGAERVQDLAALILGLMLGAEIHVLRRLLGQRRLPQDS